MGCFDEDCSKQYADICLSSINFESASTVESISEFVQMEEGKLGKVISKEDEELLSELDETIYEWMKFIYLDLVVTLLMKISDF